MIEKYRDWLRIALDPANDTEQFHKMRAEFVSLCIEYESAGELALMCGLSLTLVQKILRDFVETGVLVVENSDIASGRPLAYWLDLTKAAALLPRKRRA